MSPSVLSRSGEVIPNQTLCCVFPSADTAPVRPTEIGSAEGRRSIRVATSGRHPTNSPDFDAHRPSGATDLLLGSVHVVRIQVRHLDLGDLFDVVLADGSGRRLARRRRALVEAR